MTEIYIQFFESYRLGSWDMESEHSGFGNTDVLRAHGSISVAWGRSRAGGLGRCASPLEDTRPSWLG